MTAKACFAINTSDHKSWLSKLSGQARYRDCSVCPMSSSSFILNLGCWNIIQSIALRSQRPCLFTKGLVTRSDGRNLRDARRLFTRSSVGTALQASRDQLTALPGGPSLASEVTRSIHVIQKSMPRNYRIQYSNTFSGVVEGTLSIHSHVKMRSFFYLGGPSHLSELTCLLAPSHWPFGVNVDVIHAPTDVRQEAVFKFGDITEHI